MNTPPALDGYRYIKDLGSGGTALVYLYEQDIPHRYVAIKVDRQPLGSNSAELRFRNEANAMARLASHPNILTIYDAEVTSEGHGYLALEYCKKGSLKQLRLHQHIDLEHVLDIGVHMCSALYSAHLQGIIHRDIKPGNILLSDQETPLLCDFGISAGIYDSDAQGYSIPWSAREILSGDSTGSEASDIYSLAATLIGLMSGLSPYEAAYHPATSERLRQLILTEPLPPFSQMGIDSMTEPALRKALDPNPDARYYSALEFGRALQNLQLRLFGRVTPLQVSGAAEYAKDTLSGLRAAHAKSATMQKKSSSNSHSVTVKRTVWVVLVAGVLAMAGILAWSTLIVPHLDSLHSSQHTAISREDVAVGNTQSDPTEPDAQSEDSAEIPIPEEIKASLDGTTATFTWTNPDPHDGDIYFWKQIVSGSAQTTGAPDQGTSTSEPRVNIEHVTDNQVCIEISIVRSDHRMSQEPATACAVRQNAS